MNRVMITFSLPLSKKKEIEQIIIANSYKTKQKQSLSNYCLKSVLLYTQVQTAANFKDFAAVWSNIFVNNNNITLQNKLEILKNFEEEIKKEKEELEEYFAFKSLKKIKDVEAEKVENLGEMASWIVTEMKKKNESN